MNSKEIKRFGYGKFIEGHRQHLGQLQWNNGIHAAWLARKAGIGDATEDGLLFEALQLFAGCEPHIRFDEPDPKGKRFTIVESEWLKFLKSEGNTSLPESLTQTLDVVPPKFEDLSWEEIIDLRTNCLHEKFQTWFTEQCAGRTSASTQASLHDQVETDLWEFARNVKPNIGKTLIEGIVGNLPLPLAVSPVGLALLGRDMVEHIERRRQFGWLFGLAAASAPERQRSEPRIQSRNRCNHQFNG